MTFTMTVESDEIRRHFATMRNRVVPSLRRSTDIVALNIQNKAKVLAPRDRGDLARSITKQLVPGTSGLAQSIGSNKVYARIQELGGLAGRGLKSLIPAQPYLKPAFEDNRQSAKKIFHDNLKKDIRR
jgi:HK97 gp10 family phage protein